MTIAEPRWWRYVEYKVVDGYPVMTGFRKGTPKEIIEEYERDQKFFEEARREGIVL